MSVGEENLEALLKGLSPEQRDGEFVFCTISKEAWEKNSDEIALIQMHLIASFQEKEGWTVVLPLQIAQQTTKSLTFDENTVMGCITLTIHSSLTAVGMTAAVSKALTLHGICANVIAAYYHDHVFVPLDRVSDAINVLKTLK